MERSIITPMVWNLAFLVTFLVSTAQSFDAKLHPHWNTRRNLVKHQQRLSSDETTNLFVSAHAANFPDNSAEGSRRETRGISTNEGTSMHHAGSQPYVAVNGGSGYLPTMAMDSEGKDERVRDYLGPLLRLTRPANLPGVVLFHLMGSYLATLAAFGTRKWLQLVTRKPSMWLTLAALVLASCVSMLVNDYYDVKLGRDTVILPQDNISTKLRLKGNVPLPVARRFCSLLYAVSLVTASLLTGATTRLSVILGLMLTYWYTPHLKPIPWIKTSVCAGLIAWSPVTSASAALHVLAANRGVSPVKTLVKMSSLWRLVACVFLGIASREMLMDCNDVHGDARARVRTVPVQHGRRFTSRVAMSCTVGMAGVAVAGPACEIATSTWSRACFRRLLLASMAGLLAVRRGWKVVQTEGCIKSFVDGAVEEGLITVVILLASFI